MIVMAPPFNRRANEPGAESRERELAEPDISAPPPAYIRATTYGEFSHVLPVSAFRPGDERLTRKARKNRLNER